MTRAMFGMLAAAAIAAAALVAPAAAQSAIPLSVEARAHAAFPRGGDFEQAAAVGAGYGVTAAVQLLPNYALYGGYSRTSFDLEGVDGGRAIDSGFAVGLSRAFPVNGAGLAPWVGTGLLIHDLAVEMDGTRPRETDSSVGFEFGGGVAIPVAPRLRVTPGVAYRRYDARVMGTERERISYFTAGVGLNLAF